MGEIRLIDYTDYRNYLRDYYIQQKQKNPSFSYRVFALRAKLSSPNYLKLVIDGDRRITDKSLPNFIRGLKLSKAEAEYFRNLVFYQEAQDHDAKAMHQKELAKIRDALSREAIALEYDRIQILKSWKPWIIREMVLLDDFKEDPQWIAERLRPGISTNDVRDALALLERLEFVRRNAQGRLEQSDPLITTGDDTSIMLLKELHKQFFEFAIRSLLHDSRDEREVAGLTLAVSKKRLPEIKALIRDFRKDLNKRFSQIEGNDEVYHLSLAFFPMTKEGEQKT